MGWKKWVFVVIILVVLVIGGWYGYRKFFANTSGYEEYFSNDMMVAR